MDINLYTNPETVLKWVRTYNPIYLINSDFKVKSLGKTLTLPGADKFFWSNGPILQIGSTVYTNPTTIREQLTRLFDKGYLGVDWTFLTLQPGETAEEKILSLRSKFLQHKAPSFKKLQPLPEPERKWWEISAPSYEDYE